LRDSAGVPLIVVSQQDDNLAVVNAALREAGHPVHCRRVDDPAGLEDAIAEQKPDLILLFADETALDLAGLGVTLSRMRPPIPLILVREQVTERMIADAVSAGARDVVSLAHRNRLKAVVERELRTQRLKAALDGVVSSASQYKQELRSLMDGAAEAIADVQEGIVVHANPAWLATFGFGEEQELFGQPFMDLFADTDQAALKGGLTACLRGKWNDESLPATAQRRGGDPIPVQLRLERVTVDNEPGVRVTIPGEKTVETNAEDLVSEALFRDPSTGLFLRHHFLEQLESRLRQSLKGGVRAVAYIRPDNFSRVHNDVGILGTEALLLRFAELLREFMQPNDLYGRFGGTIFAALLERGTMTDIEAWAERLRKAVATQVFEVDRQSTTLTCTLGIAEISGETIPVADILTAAEKACRSGRDAGGNKVQLCDATSATQKIRISDAIWVPRIRAALMQNRFRLLHQPIASLQEEVEGMVDTLVRMVDESGHMVLPKEFVPPAERAHIMKNVDRWVIGASLSFCASKQPTLVFVRLSRDSVVDETLADWLQARIQSLRVKTSSVCFQISEDVATQQLKQTKELAERLQAAGFQFAIDHVGTGRDSAQLLNHVPMQFMKIDGSLMQGLNRDQELQRRVGGLAQVAKKLNIKTIAERVEDAKTMAVLWQLGIAYFQGNFVQTKGVVLGNATPDASKARG
jgi:diguanylate cyclase (GGDEF)-like protein/PAS domain S-box-containing protein